MPLFPLLFIAFAFVCQLSRNYLCFPLIINFNWRSFIFDSIGGNLIKQHFEYHYSTSSVILLSFCVYTKNQLILFPLNDGSIISMRKISKDLTLYLIDNCLVLDRFIFSKLFLHRLLLFIWFHDKEILSHYES